MADHNKALYKWLSAGIGLGLAGFGLAYAYKKRIKKQVIYAGVEAGGTTFVVSLAMDDPTNIIERHTIDTTTPEDTIAAVVKIFKNRQIDSIGVASFGPVDLNPFSPTYGYILATPKKGWEQFNILGSISTLKVPVGFQTDVNAAAMAELRYGLHGEISSCCYVTVGTGIGVGVVVDGRAVSGLTHPEGGHIRVPRHKDDSYKGNCPYHKDCLEGLANAAAIAERVNCLPSELHQQTDDHWVWPIEAYYLGHLCAILTLILSPQVIILGGGVLHRTILFNQIREVCSSELKNYILHPKIQHEMDAYIVQSRFDKDSKINNLTSPGAVGSLELARSALITIRY